MICWGGRGFASMYIYRTFNGDRAGTWHTYIHCTVKLKVLRSFDCRLYYLILNVRQVCFPIHSEAAKKVYFFNGRAYKAPPPYELNGLDLSPQPLNPPPHPPLFLYIFHKKLNLCTYSDQTGMITIQKTGFIKKIKIKRYYRAWWVLFVKILSDKSRLFRG